MGNALDQPSTRRKPRQAQGQESHDWAAVLNISSDDVVQELGWDEDCDSSISEGVEDTLGEALLDYDTDEVVDVALLWWRAEDGDLVDGLVDATRSLSDDGRIWLLTPAPARQERLSRLMLQSPLSWRGWCRPSPIASVTGRVPAWLTVATRSNSQRFLVQKIAL